VVAWGDAASRAAAGICFVRPLSPVLFPLLAALQRRWCAAAGQASRPHCWRHFEERVRQRFCQGGLGIFDVKRVDSRVLPCFLCLYEAVA